MFLYGLSLLTLVKTIKAAELGVLQPWYTDDSVMREPARCNAKILCALMGKFP